MGVLHYGQSRIQFEDRTLAHLHIVTTRMLRYNQPFFLSWTIPWSQGSGRGSIWLSRHTQVAFTYDPCPAASINEIWLDALHQAAQTNAGLVLMPGPEAD